jgi:hypothetical protein
MSHFEEETKNVGFYDDAAKCPWVKKTTKDCPFLASQIQGCPFLKSKFDNELENVVNEEQENGVLPLIKTVDPTTGFLMPSFPPCSPSDTQ